MRRIWWKHSLIVPWMRPNPEIACVDVLQGSRKATIFSIMNWSTFFTHPWPGLCGKSGKTTRLMSLDQQLTTPRPEAGGHFLGCHRRWLVTYCFSWLGVKAVQGFPQNREQGVIWCWENPSWGANSHDIGLVISPGKNRQLLGGCAIYFPDGYILSIRSTMTSYLQIHLLQTWYRCFLEMSAHVRGSFGHGQWAERGCGPGSSHCEQDRTPRQLGSSCHLYAVLEEVKTWRLLLEFPSARQPV